MLDFRLLSSPDLALFQVPRTEQDLFNVVLDPQDAARSDCAALRNDFETTLEDYPQRYRTKTVPN